MKEKEKITEDKYTIKRPYELDKHPEALLGKEKEIVGDKEETKIMKKEGEVEKSRETVKREYDLDKFEDLIKGKDGIFYKRAVKYWEEMYGIMDLLNWANPKIRITSPDSPHMTHFLLWRLLSEIKGVNYY